MTLSRAFSGVGDFAALTSTGVAGLTWINQMNDVLQLIATLVAILTGIYAIRWHRARLKELRRVLRATTMYKGTKYEDKEYEPSQRDSTERSPRDHRKDAQN